MAGYTVYQISRGSANDSLVIFSQNSEKSQKAL
jgi:hypothetical protein